MVRVIPRKYQKFSNFLRLERRCILMDNTSLIPAFKDEIVVEEGLRDKRNITDSMLVNKAISTKEKANITSINTSEKYSYEEYDDDDFETTSVSSNDSEDDNSTLTGSQLLAIGLAGGFIISEGVRHLASKVKQAYHEKRSDSQSLKSSIESEKPEQ